MAVGAGGMYGRRGGDAALLRVLGAVVRRNGAGAGRAGRAGLLADIWGQGTFPGVRPFRDRGGTGGGGRTKVVKHKEREEREIEKHKKGEEEKDGLVRVLRKLRGGELDDEYGEGERCALRRVVEAGCDVGAIARLFGVPVVCLEESGLARGKDGDVERFYGESMAGRMSDERMYRVLARSDGECHGIRVSVVARVVRKLLCARKSALYNDNMDIAVEAALFAIDPDVFASRFTLTRLRACAFCATLRRYEHARAFTGAFEAISPSRLGRLLRDLQAVRALSQPHTSLTLGAIHAYCAENLLLTARAVAGVFRRHARAAAGTAASMTAGEFTRLYLALTACATDSSVRYWFAVLDQDGDGRLGRADVAHFYSARRRASEAINGAPLAGARAFWTRLRELSGADERGVTQGMLLRLGAKEREFVLCALLVRRADDGHLVDVSRLVQGAGSATDAQIAAGSEADE